MEKNNYFVCRYKRIVCALTFEECTKQCKHVNQCGNCENYYIPAGQFPCSQCSCMENYVKRVKEESNEKHK